VHGKSHQSILESIYQHQWLIHVGAILGRQLKIKEPKKKRNIAKKGNRSNAAIENFVLQASRRQYEGKGVFSWNV